MFEDSGSLLTTVSLIIPVLVLLYYWSTRKPKGFPPGPRWLPILGSALELGRLRAKTGYFSESCNVLSRRYGSMIGLKVGVDKIVILNDYESMKAMIVNEHCDGRPTGPVYDARTFGKRQGLLVVDGHLWVEQRRFILRHLRDFGFGRTDMAKQIEYEASQLVKYYESLIENRGGGAIERNDEDDVKKIDDNNNNNKVINEAGKRRKNGKIYRLEKDDVEKRERKARATREEQPKRTITAGDFYAKLDDGFETDDERAAGIVVQMEEFFGVPVLNTLWCMMAGKRYDIDHKELIYLQKILTAIFRDCDMVGCLFGHFPALRYLAPGRSGYNTFVARHAELWKFLKNELENHKKTYDANNPHDLMDVYLKVLQSQCPCDDTFSESQLLSICVDLFMAGSETSSKALSFGFLFLVLNPEVQKKAQREIDSVIGRERLPTLNDRPRLTYINAVVLESVRMFMGRTMNIPHRALKDTEILGYKIPKDSMLVVNFNNILMGDYWGDPEEFRPDRFIDETGKLIMHEQYLPFSFGKHRCMGEVLAKCNMFVITAALLQNFNFTPVPGEEPPRNEYTDGVTASPKPFRVLMTKRT